MRKVKAFWCAHIHFDRGGLLGRWGWDWVLVNPGVHRSFSMSKWDYCPLCGKKRPRFPGWCKGCGRPLLEDFPECLHKHMEKKCAPR